MDRKRGGVMKMRARDVTLVMISSAYPEQYDALDLVGREIGYVSLKRGYLAAYCPDAGSDDIVYERIFRSSIPCFQSERQRKWHLWRIKKAIAAWWNMGAKVNEVKQSERSDAAW